jgi:hypothetical protein
VKKKIIKWGLVLVVSGIVIGGGAVLYMFNMPHRDVQAASADFQMDAKDLVNEYLTDADAANDKYLQEEGDSKIIAITGVVASISEDMNMQKVVLLKDAGEKAGVSCTFMASTNANAANLKKGNKVTIKGVIRSGAGYDEDLELFEDVIIEKSDVLHN